MTFADNPAVANPNKALNMAQRDALLSIAFFKRHRNFGKTWTIGTKRFSARTIATLERMELVKPSRHGGLDLTLAGQVARDKLAGK